MLNASVHDTCSYMASNAARETARELIDWSLFSSLLLIPLYELINIAISDGIIVVWI